MRFCKFKLRENPKTPLPDWLRFDRPQADRLCKRFWLNRDRRSSDNVVKRDFETIDCIPRTVLAKSRFSSAGYCTNAILPFC